MKKNCLNLFLSILLFFNFSCASIMNGTTENIHLRSNVPDTDFYLNGIKIGSNTTVTTVRKKDLKNLKIVAMKEGCGETSTDIETRFDPVTLLGLLIDLGLISILVVDWGINGAVREAKRTGYVLDPICDDSNLDHARSTPGRD